MTDRELHELASAAFLELRSMPEPRRTARLAELAGVDSRLHDEVRSLLAFDSPGGAPVGSGMDFEAGSLPERIGPYRVLSRLGRGASGFVLLGEQEEPVRRRVAIKVVPYAAVSPASAARFEFERRALERTEHPNIARILDSGRTADGLPYIVMDFVDGATITEFCRLRGLGLRERIGLMLGVVDAVGHAHQRGVIHRDIKPGNILVADIDGRATARVLDFGIAKPVATVDEGDASMTMGLPIGTPAYMSPEQTGAGVVDTRSDIYGLGAVLYELVCGRPPIETRGDQFEALRRVREQAPAPASGWRAGVGGVGGTGGSVSGSFRHDLDRVLAKCLEKSPARRYSTAAELGDDRNRVLRREPVLAGRRTHAERLSRFVERRRGLAASIGVAVVATVVGVGGLAWGLVEARRQREAAEVQGEALAAVNRFLTDDLLGATAPGESGISTPAIELLRRASERVDSRLAGRPLVAAAVHSALGNAFMELGAFEEAGPHVGSALSLRREHAGPDAPETVQSEVLAASLIAQRQDYEAAIPVLNEAVARARRILGPDDPVLYTALNNLGVASESMGLGKEAVGALTEALAGRVRLLGDHDPDVMVTLSNLAQAYDRLGDTERSLDVTIRALRIVESSAEPSTMLLLGLNNNIGATYQDLQRDEEAAPYLRRAAALASEWLGPDDPNTLTIRGNLAGLEADLGDPARAVELYGEVVAGQQRVLGPDGFGTLTARYGLCNSFWLASRFEESAGAYAVLLDDTTRVLGADHWLTLQTECSLARSLLDCGRAGEAAPHAERAAAGLLALYGTEHSRSRSASDLDRRIQGVLEVGRGDAASEGVGVP